MNNNKRIRHRHIHALRDLSRCHNFNGVKIKKGVFFRSGYLGKLNEKQADQFIQEFNIGYVIDLRTDEEVKIAPDANFKGVKYFHVPVLEAFDNPVITKETRTEILLDIAKNKGGAVNYLSRVYAKMVTDEYCLDQFKKIFQIFLNKEDDKAIIFHCSQGKDRTGVLSALILYALGVDESSIFYDYRRFNTAYRFKNFMISVLVAFRFFSFKVSKDLYFLQMAHKKLIHTTFDEIKKVSDDRLVFFEKSLGLDESAINKLRDMYLIKE